MEDLKVISTSCLPPCEGLFVTSFSKFQTEKKSDEGFPEAEAYNKYKILTQMPSNNPYDFGGKDIFTIKSFSLTIKTII